MITIYATVNHNNGNIDISPDGILFDEDYEIFNAFAEEVKNRFLGATLNQQNLKSLQALIDKTNEKLKNTRKNLTITFLIEE